MFKNKNIVALFLCILMCFLVGCTGDPVEKETSQVLYSNYVTSSTSVTTTVLSTGKNKLKNKKKIDNNKSDKAKKDKSKKFTTLINSNKNNNKNKVKVSNKQNASKITKTTIIYVETTTTTTIVTTQNTVATTLAPLSDTDICYVTASGEKYHRQGCRYLNKSCIEIIVREAKEKEYTPCKVCKP